MAKKPQQTDEEFMNEIADKTQGSRIQWRAQLDLQERAGSDAVKWAKIAAWAAVAGAIFAVVALLK